jgi:hypothetical protein
MRRCEACAAACKSLAAHLGVGYGYAWRTYFSDQAISEAGKRWHDGGHRPLPVLGEYHPAEGIGGEAR